MGNENDVCNAEYNTEQYGVRTLRTLKLVVFSVLFFLSSNLAYSLGVGDIQVNSSLNQPLNAEIALVSLRPGEIDNIKVSMATPAEFARAGIDRPLVLALLKFRVEERAGNKAAIIVYSKKAIKEPFLDFLVEIDWASGRMLREYTMLLDPPTFAQKKAERVIAPIALAPAPVVNKPEPAPVQAPAPAPVVSAAPVERTPTFDEVPARPDNELFPRIDIGATAQPAANTEPFRPALDVNSDGYKTKKNDTLWSISDRLRPEGISIEQMMLALQNSNPGAFENNNINGLKAGYVLRIPDQDALLAFSKSEAFRAAQDQHNAWNSARGGLINRATTKGTAPVSESATPVAPAATPKSGVKLVTPKAGVASKGAGTGKDLDALRQELALVNEQLASKEQQNTDLVGRLRELEEQIASMERLLELKSKSLEDLQNKVTEPAPVPVTPVQPETVVTDKPAEPTVPTGPVEVPDTINPYAVKDLPKPEVAPAPVVKPSPTVKPTPAPVPAPAPVAEESIVDIILGILDDVTVLAMVGVALIGVLALLWIVIHRRRMNSMSFPESILTDKGASTTTDMEKTEETSLLSDFAPTSMGSQNIESEVGEVDPLSEADVYLAYNKFQQAEELLQNAINGEPDRTDLKVKLLEVHYNAKNSNAFAELAEDVHSGIGDQDAALWDKVSEMGSDLCPDNPLFGTADEGLDIAELDESASSDDVTDDLEFDLGDLELDAEPEAEPEPAPVEDLAAPAAEEETTDSGMDIDVGDLDDLSLDMDTAADEEPSLELDMGSSEVADDLGELSLDTPDETPAEADDSSDMSMDLGELDLDALDASMEEDAATEAPAAEAATEDDSFTIDEVATKLDLAKAYIDMGDPDGARSILDEVLTEGNDGQKSEAQDLIQQL